MIASRNQISKDHLALDDGFTLMEVLVSLMLMGMVMMLIYSTLGFSARALDRGVLQTASSENLVQSQTLLRDMIEGSIPDRSSFVGQSNEMTFLTKFSRNGEMPEVYEIKLTSENDTLTLNWVLQDDTSQNGELILVSDVADIQFQYGSDALYEDHIWQHHWDAEKLPSFVKIIIESDEFWPEMVITPLLTHTVDCRYDPVSRDCEYR